MQMVGVPGRRRNAGHLHFTNNINTNLERLACAPAQSAELCIDLHLIRWAAAERINSTGGRFILTGRMMRWRAVVGIAMARAQAATALQASTAPEAEQGASAEEGSDGAGERA